HPQARLHRREEQHRREQPDPHHRGQLPELPPPEFVAHVLLEGRIAVTHANPAPNPVGTVSSAAGRMFGMAAKTNRHAAPPTMDVPNSRSFSIRLEITPSSPMPAPIPTPRAIIR